MLKDAFWELFCDTGEPMCWLMHRARGEDCAGRRTPQEADAGRKNTSGR